MALLVLLLTATVRGQVAFQNDTGSTQDGLRVELSQPPDQAQPVVLSPSGTATIAPFTVATAEPRRRVLLSGGTVAPGTRVPSDPTQTMAFQPTVVGSAIEVVNAQWLSGGTPTHSMALVYAYNYTGLPANEMVIQAVNASGQPMAILQVSIPASAAPDTCPPMVTGTTGTTATISTGCPISPAGGLAGPVLLTFTTAESVCEVRIQFRMSGSKVGSSASRVLVNVDANGDPVGTAAAFSTRTNMAVDHVSPPEPNPLPQVAGMRSASVYASCGVVPPEASLSDPLLIVTSTDVGGSDIEITNLTWYRPAATSGSVPELMYYRFDEVGLGNTANQGGTPVGNATPPVTGHSIGGVGQFGAALVGAGGGSNSNFVDTGWTPNLPADFTVGFWITGTSNPPAGMAVFGEPTGTFNCTVNGSDIALRFGLGPFVLPYTITNAYQTGQSVSVAWVRDSTAGAVRTYLDGVLVATSPIFPIPVTGNGSLKIGAGAATEPALDAGALVDEFRLYDRALSDSEISATFDRPLPLSATSQAQWQTNSAAALLTIDGVAGGAFAPAVVTRCVNEGAMVTIDTVNVGAPFDIVTTAGIASMVPATGGGMTFSPSAILNLDPTLPFSSQFGLTFMNNFPGTVSIPLPTGVTEDRYAQMVVVQPAVPNGLTFSAAVQLTVTNAGSLASVPGPQGDDVFVQVMPSAQPLCGPASIPFAGTSYTDLFIDSNGTVSFGAGVADASPTVAEFMSGPPRLAGLWTDLAPNEAGTVEVRVLYGAVIVSFDEVAVAGSGGAIRHSVDLVFDTGAGSAAIYGFSPDAAHSIDTLVGLSPGGGATDPGSMMFSSLVGLGPQTGSTTDMVYEFVAGGAPSGFYSVVFPNADGGTFVVQ